jgi:PDZ domain-containing protein
MDHRSRKESERETNPGSQNHSNNGVEHVENSDIVGNAEGDTSIEEVPVVGDEGSNRKLSVRKLLRRAAAGFAIGLLAALPFQETSFVAMKPGPLFEVVMENTEETIPVVEDNTWAFTTIAVKRLNWLEFAFETVRNGDDVYPTGGSTGGVSSDAEMAASKLTAAAVVDFLLYHLSTPTAWAIINVIPDGPAESLGILPNDQIIEVNGLQVRSVKELRNLLRAGPVTLSLRRGSDQYTVDVDVTGKGAYLGVQLTPIGIPERVDGNIITTEDVGGGSGGLMFTLALLDKYSDGDLAGGKRIAGTGTIQPDGSVGRIVGAAYKFRAAEQAGYDVFFVPASLRDELPGTSRVEIVSVEDIGDAVAWLCSRDASTTLLCSSSS